MEATGSVSLLWKKSVTAKVKPAPSHWRLVSAGGVTVWSVTMISSRP